jgi:hypothetical protein
MPKYCAMTNWMERYEVATRLSASSGSAHRNLFDVLFGLRVHEPVVEAGHGVPLGLFENAVAVLGVGVPGRTDFLAELYLDAALFLHFPHGGFLEFFVLVEFALRKSHLPSR